MSVGDAAAVGLAGGAGAVTRFLVDSAVGARMGRRSPVGTGLINLSGSLLLGVLTGLVVLHGAPSELTVVAGTGFCGGYTTFSTAAVQTVRLLQGRSYRQAAVNWAVTVVGTVAAAAVGFALAGAL